MIIGLFNYWVVVILMMIGFYIVIAHGNLIKKIVGLTIFQTSVFIFYISMAKVSEGTAPILVEEVIRYSNPLPHVLILTAIVVGISTTALGLAITVRIKEAYDSIEEDEIQKQDNQAQDAHSFEAHRLEMQSLEIDSQEVDSQERQPLEKYNQKEHSPKTEGEEKP